MHKSVVTGGAGFLGSFMVDLLMQRGHHVVAIDNFEKGKTAWLDKYEGNERFQMLDADICVTRTDLPVFDGMEYMFHFGGLPEKMPSFTQPAYYHEVNGMGTVRMLECCRRGGFKKFVYAMTSAIYGEIPEGATHGSQETDEISFETPYALSKYIGELAGISYAKTFNVPFNSIRIINAFGPRVRAASEGGALFHVFMKAKLEGQPLPVLGDGTQKRDFIYASDICEAMLLAAESNFNCEIWNVGGGNPKTVNHVAHLIGGPVEYKPPRGHEPKITWSDNSKIARDLGWKPTSNFDERVREMMQDLSSWR